MNPGILDGQPTGYEEKDYEAGEKAVIERAFKNSRRAIATSKAQYWNAIDSVKSIYGTYQTSPVSKEAANDKNFELTVNDVADQADEMFAIGKNLMAGKAKRKLKPIRNNPSDEKQVSMTEKAQDSFLREHGFDDEVSLAWMRFVKYSFGGLKVCRTRRKRNKNERIEIPTEGATPGQGLSSRDLLMQGYSLEQVQSGFAVRHKCAKMGLRFQGFADEQALPDKEGNPIYTKITCIKTTNYWEDSVYGKAVDPRRLGIFDPNRALDKQSSIHEFHYLSMDEIRDIYPYNSSKFKEKASPESAANQEPGGTSAGATNGPVGSEDFPIYEVTETWIDIDWEELIKEGKITEETILALSERFCIPYEEFFVRGKWCMIHWKDGCMLDLYPNYLWDRDEYPYDIESYIFQEERFCDKGLVHRISSPCAGKHKIRNMVYKNIRRMLNQSRIVSRRLGLTDDDLEQLEQENGNVWASGQAVDLAQDIQFHLPPDATGPGFKLLGMLDSDKQQLGVSATMAGQDDSGTATQANINQNRGQIIANESFSRFVGMLLRFYKKHLGAMIATVTRGRMIRALGEDGSTFQETWITPSDLTDRVEIVPMVSFNDQLDQQKAQFLLGLVNVFAPFSQPQEIIAMKHLIMRLGGITKDELDEIEGKLGSYTNVAQEVESMLDDPSVEPVVRMTDIHQLCVAVAKAALQRRMDEYKKLGVTPNLTLFNNIMTYIQAHEAMQQQQEMTAKLMTPPPTKGKPKNEEAEDGEKDARGGARESGQKSSPPDQGQQTNAGFTGAGSQPQNTGMPA